MSRKTQFHRLAKLERRVNLIEVVTEDMILDWRASGLSEGEIIHRSMDSHLSGKLPFDLREDSIYEMGLMWVPHHWAAQHPDKFFRLIGQLDEGILNISFDHADLLDRRAFVVDSRLADSLDPIALVFLSDMAYDPEVWHAYWRAHRDRLFERPALVWFYVATAKLRTEKLEEDLGAEETAKRREKVRETIDEVRRLNKEHRDDEFPNYYEWDGSPGNGPNSALI